MSEESRKTKQPQELSEKKISRKKALSRRPVRRKTASFRPEKPAFAEEKNLFKKRSFTGQFLSFRRSGLGVFDAFFNAFYMTLTEKSIEKEEKRLKKKGLAQSFSHLDHHGFILKLISFLPRKIGAIRGYLTSLWTREAGKGKYSKREFFKKHQFAFALIGFALLIALFIAVQLSRPVVLRAEIDGKVIGVVESKHLVDSAVNQLEDNVEIILGKNFHFPYKISYSFARQWGRTLTDKSKISETLYTYVSDYICTASGLYVDDVLVAVCQNEEEIQRGLDDLVAAYALPGEVGIFNEIRIITQAYPTESILQKEAYSHLLKEMLVPLADRKKEHVDAVLTPEASLNPSQNESVPVMAAVADSAFIPETKKISKSNYPEPIDEIKLDFYRSEYRRYEVEVPFKTQYVESRDHYTSMVDTTQVGSNGLATVEEEIFYVNGKEAKRKVLGEVVHRAPVNRVISIGTKLLPEELEDSSSLGEKVFIVPKVGMVNYYYGYRESGMHYGWDIPGNEGDNLYAAASGTVIVAIGQNGSFSNRPENHFGGYGYCVVIQHENGFSTMYAHCSKIFVQLGQEVKQGEKIAAVGNTGNSTGNHVHFEIEKNGRKLDPARYFYQGKATIYD